MKATPLRPKLKDAVRLVENKLEEARSKFAVDLFAFFVGNDPFLPSFLRCLAAPGVEFVEAASHFRLKQFPVEGDFGFIEDVRTDLLRNRDGEIAERLIQQDAQRNLVFGDFVTREKIASRAWFVQRDSIDGRPEALLTVNYRQPRNEQQWHQHDCRPLQELFHDLVGQLEVIENLLKEMYSSLVWDFLRIINVALPTEIGPGPHASCAQSLERLLTLATEALLHISSDTPPEKWCGTIYLLDPSCQRLRLEGQVGSPRLQPHEFDIEAGEGVVSWVAVRTQAVRIRDLALSPRFEAIHRDLIPGIRSQLAVPMIRAGRVIGVLSLESPDPDVFSLTSVGFLTRIAGLVAAILEMEQVRGERDHYLEAVYASKRLEIPLDPLPSLDDLVRTTPIR